jgi:translocator protein
MGASAVPGPQRDRPAGRSVRVLLLSLLLAYAAAAIGAVASVDAATFYVRLAQPAWAPPPWIFGPVWTVLYTLMAVALWRVWRTHSTRSRPVRLFLAQLAVNAAWSWVFFRWHLGALAFWWILALLVLIAATVRAFWTVDRAAAALLLPYLAWVAFACALAGTLWRGNPAALG